jgi:hypothetical protein
VNSPVSLRIASGLSGLALAASMLFSGATAVAADSGFITLPRPASHPATFALGVDSGSVLVGKTEYLPSINIVGAPNPTVDWGDGTVDTLQFDTNPSDAVSPCFYYSDVIGCQLSDHHTYSTSGDYSITSTYYTGAFVSYSQTYAVQVVAQTSISPAPYNFYTTAAAPYSGLVATFLDNNTVDPASDFAATIDWGDGSTSAGTVTGAMAYFSANGSHTYASPGTFAVDVTVRTHLGQAIDVFSTAHVAAPPANVEINDSEPGITFTGTGWFYSPNRGFGDFQDDEHATTLDGDSLAYTFTGTGVTVVGERNAVDGTALVILDGVGQGSVSTAASTRVVQNPLYAVDGLASGRHTLQVVKTTGEYLEIDALIVRNATQTPAPTATTTPTSAPTSTPTPSPTPTVAASSTLKTTTSVSTSNNNASRSASITFTAAVQGSATGVLSGTVTFKVDSRVLGTAALNHGIATFSTTGGSIGGGTHIITAVYSGDARFGPSTSTGINQIIRASS